MLCASVLIDDVVDHAYKAHLLARTLNDFGAIGYHRIRVHHTPDVSRSIVQEFADLGCVTRETARFLEGRHSNKITQLSQFSPSDLEGLAGIVLLDTDVAVSRPIRLPDYDRVCGKVVDAANPPFKVLLRIFEAAGVQPPSLVATDWGNGATFSTNLNGGFLYFPSALVQVVSDAWTKFANFLYANQTLFDSCAQAAHIDQVALALALASLSLAVTLLPANLNFPSHSAHKPLSLDESQEITTVHYHRELDGFGQISPTNTVSQLKSAVHRINACTSGVSPAAFREFRAASASRREISSVVPDVLSRDIASWLETLPHRPAFVFHAGTPKTGTTAFQYWLESNRGELAKRGVWYPETFTQNVPKHQFLVSQLTSGNADEFATAIMSALSAVTDETRVILLSTEGLYNHWRDFCPTGLAMLRFLASKFSVEILICFRDPLDFAVSLYKQNLRNPKVHPCYGTDQSFDDMLSDRWFAAHLDYIGFILEAAYCLQQGTISIFDYSPDVIAKIGAHLGVADVPNSDEQYNPSIGGLGANLLRVINSTNLEVGVRDLIIKRIGEIERLAGSPLFGTSESARTRVANLSARSVLFLKELTSRSSDGLRLGNVTVRFVPGEGAGAV